MRKLFAGLTAISLALAPVSASYAAPGDNHVVRVHNQSGINATIIVIALQDSDGEIYTANNGTVHAGYYRDINFDNGSGDCYYNIAAKFDNGVVAKHAAVDVCKISDWYVYDRDSTVQ